VARREASFKEQVASAEGLWEKQQYDSAAKVYAKAWEDSPGHLDIEMEAATGFLMADQVPSAVDALVRLRNSRSDDLSGKAAAMLKELGPVSETARGEVALERRPPAGEQSGDAAERIANLVGQLTTPKMELAAKTNPPLIQDTTHIIQVPDEEITAGPNNIGLQSTQSVFRLYQRDLPTGGATPAETQPPPAGNFGPAASPAAAIPSPADRAILPRTLLPASGVSEPRAAESAAFPKDARPVTFNSDPAGAAIVFDDVSSLNCTTPCRMPLAPGRHTLLATLAGYQDALKVWTVDKSASPVELTLVAKQGALTVESETPGAAVFLNGKKTDQQTPAQFTLAEGDYEVSIAVGGEMVVKHVAIKDGGLYRVSF
jgi:hypothetical protein